MIFLTDPAKGRSTEKLKLKRASTATAARRLGCGGCFFAICQIRERRGVIRIGDEGSRAG